THASPGTDTLIQSNHEPHPFHPSIPSITLPSPNHFCPSQRPRQLDQTLWRPIAASIHSTADPISCIRMPPTKPIPTKARLLYCMVFKNPSRSKLSSYCVL